MSQIFSQRLISLRNERNLTQADMAKIIQKSRSTVAGWEAEGKEPDMDTICFFAKFFGVSCDYILGFSDERNRVDVVFCNDNVNFKEHYDVLPAEIKSKVAQAFDSFYLLLNRDMKPDSVDRLDLYVKLLRTVQRLRADIRNSVNSFGGSFNDPVALSGLMALQSELKNTTSAILDELMQADIEIAFKTKNDGENLQNTAT